MKYFSREGWDDMGATCAKCRTVTIQAIPDKDVMLGVVDRSVEFENMLKAGDSLTRAQAKEKKALEPVARALRKVQAKKGSDAGV